MLPLLPSASRFPIPDWSAAYASVPANTDTATLDTFYTEREREFVRLVRNALGKDYQGYESKNIWLVSREPADTCRRLIAWAEATEAKVKTMLNIDPTGILFGKLPIFILHDLAAYDEYVSGYLTDGEYADSGGMYINHGCGHFVFNFHDMTRAESVMAHEIAHALVTHLPLPLWLNEGVAQLCEIEITGRDHIRHDEIKETIDGYWTEKTIQHFWDGTGFTKNGESQMHCYHLAKVLTRKLARRRDRFHAFLHSANYDDAGAAALRAEWDISLEELVADYLGAGNWSPRASARSNAS